MMGWKCPGCGRCYSPFTSQCQACVPPSIPAVTTTPYLPGTAASNTYIPDPVPLPPRGRTPGT
jgi:hypothetical protein